MTTNKTNREAIEMLEEGIVKLNEVRQNLADMDIGDELLQQLAVVVARAKVQDYTKSSKVLDIVADFYRIVANQCLPVADIRKAQKIVFHLQGRLLDHEALLDLGKKVFETDLPRVLSYKITLVQSHQVLVMMRLMNG